MTDVEVGFDINDSAVLMNDGEICTTCCAPPEYSTNDCCCFLEPLDLWNVGHGVYNVDDKVEYTSPEGQFRCKVQHTSSADKTPANTTYWEQTTSVRSCGNENWNSYPLFGGPGKTPLYFVVTISGSFSGDCEDELLCD